MVGIVELPRDILSDETSQQDDNVWIIEDKSAVKISKT